MPFNTSTLATAIKDAFDAAFAETEDRDAAAQAVADAISDEVGNQVKACIESMTIVYTAGLTSPSGPVAGVFNYTITATKT